MTALSLRPYQARAADWTREAWVRLRSQGRRASVCLQLPTGGGKTVILSALEPDLVIAPNVDLVRQLAERIPGARVETIQALSRRQARGEALPEAQRVALDEARWALSPQWLPVVQAYLARGVELVAVDATPASADGRGLGCIAEELYQVASMRELISAGYLVPFKVLAPSTRVEDLAEDPYTAWLNCTPGESAIVFAEHKAHARAIRARFVEGGIRSEVIADETPVEERRAIIDGLRDGSIRVAVCAQILRQGIDVPRVSSIVLARAIGSYPLWMQAIGRGGRPFPGKSACTVLDLRGAIHVHGLPDEPREWTLEGAATLPGETLPPCVMCADCGAWGRGGGCLICGASLPPPPPPKIRAQDLIVIRQLETDEKKKKTLERYVREALARGHNPWAAKHRYRGTYGVEPPNAWVYEAIRG